MLYPCPANASKIALLFRYTENTIMFKSNVALTTLILATTSINADKLRSLRFGGLDGLKDRFDFDSIKDAIDFDGIKDAIDSDGLKNAIDFDVIKDAIDFDGIKDAIDSDGIKDAIDLDGLKDALPPFRGIFDWVLVDLSCPAPVTNEPDCALHNGKLGNWVYRTLFEDPTGDSESWSTCADTTRALPLDACGCCNGSCPTQCNCGCPEADGGGTGVLVTVTKYWGEDEVKCIAPEKAISLVAKPGNHFQCATECSTTP
jgi:hypothetical protein